MGTEGEKEEWAFIPRFLTMGSSMGKWEGKGQGEKWVFMGIGRANSELNPPSYP